MLGNSTVPLCINLLICFVWYTYRLLSLATSRQNEIDLLVFLPQASLSVLCEHEESVISGGDGGAWRVLLVT